MFEFFKENWINLGLIIVGAFALIVYILQERKKVSEAASLIKLQIDELQNGISEIDSYIVNGQLNFTAFYESQLLYNEDYWNKYKHFFVKKIDPKDFGSISKLYGCANEIQEQQVLMKSLQKNFFYVSQQVISNLETTEIMKSINAQNSSQFISEFMINLSKEMSVEFDEETMKKISDMIGKVANDSFSNSNQNNPINNRQQIISYINQHYFTSYCPEQIRFSLEKYIKKYSLLKIDGTDGYKTIKSISERKF